MQVWSVRAQGAGAVATRAGDGPGRVVDALGTATFGAALLDGIGDAVGAGSMCAWRIAPSAPPVRYCSASHERRDRTGSCWAAYRDDLYRHDATFEAIGDALPDACASRAWAVGHLTADDVTYLPHRQRIYRDHALLDRLTVAAREPNGDLLAVNFYHHVGQGYFTDRAIARFEGVVPLVVATVRRHHAWTEGRQALAGGGERAERIASFERMLGDREPALTERERAVCARLLAGMLYAGIAVDLGLRLPTVKTYRNRAFERLGIHFRNELFPIVVGPDRSTA